MNIMRKFYSKEYMQKMVIEFFGNLIILIGGMLLAYMVKILFIG